VGGQKCRKCGKSFKITLIPGGLLNLQALIWVYCVKLEQIKRF
jgi:hypothetical protein